MTAMRHAFPFLFFTLFSLACTGKPGKPRPDPAPADDPAPVKSAAVKPATDMPAVPPMVVKTPVEEPAPPSPPQPAPEPEPPSEHPPLQGCGLVTADDNQGALDVRVVSTEKYCDQSTEDLDLHFTALVDKKTNRYPAILVGAVMVDPTRVAYGSVSFQVRDKTVKRKTELGFTEEDCPKRKTCEVRQSVIFEVDRAVLEHWAAKGGDVKFGTGRTLPVDPKEAKDFLKKLTELGAKEGAAAPAP